MNFDDAFTKVIGNEGGYVNDVHDSGGETKFGISKRAYPNEDIRNLTLEHAKALYARDYWHPAGCDAVPDLLKFELFDMAVNQGVGSAVRALQYACGAPEDGALGPKTLSAIANDLPIRLLFRFDAARLVHYAECSDANLLRYGIGWRRRTGRNMVDA